VNYFTFLLQWYNWPYLAAIVLAAASLARLGWLGRVGARLGGWLGVRRVSGHRVLRVFTVALALVGLTLNGALHDYLPTSQERGFLPGLLLAILIAGLTTRAMGRVFERHFPEIKAIGWGARHLTGSRGRVVSRMVSRDYRAGRAQVMGEDETLHIVLCKTEEGEIPYGAVVELGEYDQAAGRYNVERVEDGEASRDD
jgi:hypothetical protein